MNEICLRPCARFLVGDRKSTRLNSSHGYISYAVFCLKKKKKNVDEQVECNREGWDVAQIEVEKLLQGYVVVGDIVQGRMKVVGGGDYCHVNLDDDDDE